MDCVKHARRRGVRRIRRRDIRTAHWSGCRASVDRPRALEHRLPGSSLQWPGRSRRSGCVLGVVKGRDIIRAAGMSRLARPGREPPPTGDAALVDTSAVMDRYLLVLGRAGLLEVGLVLPRFVVDEVRTLAESPDPVTSRRATTWLEAVETLRVARSRRPDRRRRVPADLEDAGHKAIAVAHAIRSPGGDVLGRGGRSCREAGDLRVSTCDA